MMDDRISDLPEAVLIHILSFVPTKQCVSTCLVSKTWKHLWRYVPTFYFHDYHQYSLLKSVNEFMLSRDLNTPLQRFYLHCLSIDPLIGKKWIATAAQCKVEYLDISLHERANLTSALLCCKTLVVLKLLNVHLSFKSFSPDFPVLKHLHLQYVRFSKYRDLAHLLSGTPILEDLQVVHLYFENFVCEEKFKPLPKLVKANIVTDQFPLEIVCNVKDLRIALIKYGCLIPEFQNLTSLKFCYRPQAVLDFIKHCPKLQILVICPFMQIKDYPEYFVADVVYPPKVPKCISSHLKTCSLYHYYDSKDEFPFARYVMQNARHLVTMKIYGDSWTKSEREKCDMLKKLASCSRCSTTCKLLFV